MAEQWLSTSWQQAGLVVVSTVATYAVIILYVRMAGLRSFAKMSSADFAMTVAVGSLLASTASSSSVTLANGALAIGVLFVAQGVVAAARRRVGFDRVVDNTPIVLMTSDGLIAEHLDRSRVTESDIRAKLREANAHDLSKVHAVVLETTGDISVLHGDRPPDRAVLVGVTGADRVARPGA